MPSDENNKSNKDQLEYTPVPPSDNLDDQPSPKKSSLKQPGSPPREDAKGVSFHDEKQAPEVLVEGGAGRTVRNLRDDSDFQFDPSDIRTTDLSNSDLGRKISRQKDPLEQYLQENIPQGVYYNLIVSLSKIYFRVHQITFDGKGSDASDAELAHLTQFINWLSSIQIAALWEEHVAKPSKAFAATSSGILSKDIVEKCYQEIYSHKLIRTIDNDLKKKASVNSKVDYLETTVVLVVRSILSSKQHGFLEEFIAHVRDKLEVYSAAFDVHKKNKSLDRLHDKILLLMWEYKCLRSKSSDDEKNVLTAHFNIKLIEIILGKQDSDVLSYIRDTLTSYKDTVQEFLLIKNLICSDKIFAEIASGKSILELQEKMHVWFEEECKELDDDSKFNLINVWLERFIEIKLEKNPDDIMALSARQLQQQVNKACSRYDNPLTGTSSGHADQVKRCTDILVRTKQVLENPCSISKHIKPMQQAAEKTHKKLIRPYLGLFAGCALMTVGALFFLHTLGASSALSYVGLGMVKASVATITAGVSVGGAGLMGTVASLFFRHKKKHAVRDVVNDFTTVAQNHADSGDDGGKPQHSPEVPRA